MSWQEFWDGETPIYVNERHRLLHYRLIARGIIELIQSLGGEAQGTGRRAAVLDYGCGEALCADEVAARCSKLYLCDGAASVRANLATRFAGRADLAVLTPVEVADIEEASLDLVVACSLVQYLTAPQLAAALRQWRHALKPTGRLLLADVLPKGHPALADALTLLRFGFQGGFLLAACGGLVRTAISDYRKLRSELGLMSYDETDMIALLAEAGFAAERHRPNLGHNQTRMAFLARPV